jgi:hypothetical protein
MVAARNEICRNFGALQDNAAVGLVLGQFNGFIEQGFVGDDAIDFDAAGGRDDEFGLGGRQKLPQPRRARNPRLPLLRSKKPKRSRRGWIRISENCGRLQPGLRG